MIQIRKDKTLKHIYKNARKVVKVNSFSRMFHSVASDFVRIFFSCKMKFNGHKDLKNQLGFSKASLYIAYSSGFVKATDVADVTKETIFSLPIP